MFMYLNNKKKKCFWNKKSKQKNVGTGHTFFHYRDQVCSVCKIWIQPAFWGIHVLYTVNRFGESGMMTVFDIWLVESGYWSFIYAQEAFF